MGLLARILRIPRPESFLYLMSLRTGTELITLSLLLNKVSGIYGLLALLTGIHLSHLQLSMYIYSLIALVITVHLSPHIRIQSPFQCLALACFYILDSVINAAYTAAFAMTWFLVVSQHHSDAAGDKAPGAGGSTMDATAGFTSPAFNVSHVDVAVAADASVIPRDEAVLFGAPGFKTTASGPSLGHGFSQAESIDSLALICGLWAVRIYFILVVMSYARLVLREHIVATSRTPNPLGAKSSPYMENPFAPHLAEGKGWKGRLGRIMIGLSRGYWLENEAGNDAWFNGMEGRFRRRIRTEEAADPPGLEERERRRRSGTGPPPPAPQLLGGQGQFLRV